MTHQLKNASATYGAFGSVIGIVALLLLLAKLSMYAAELNPVLARRLYPRALPLGGEPTDADRQVLASIAHAEQRRDDQVIGVGFGEDAADQAASDAIQQKPHATPLTSRPCLGWSAAPDANQVRYRHSGRQRRRRRIARYAPCAQENAPRPLAAGAPGLAGPSWPRPSADAADR